MVARRSQGPIAAGMLRRMSAFFRRRKPEPTPVPPNHPAGDGPVPSGPGASFGETSQTTYITGDRQRDTDRVRLLIDSLRAVSSEVDPDGLLVEMVDRAVKTVGAERGLLFTAGLDGKPVLRVARSAQETDLPQGVTWSSMVVESVLAGGESVCRREDDGGDFDPSQSMISLDIRAVMCVPLVFRDERQGVIYVDARASERLFHRSDLRFFEAFADMLSIVWTNRQIMEERLRGERMKRDLELVREIQGNLLPIRPLRAQGFSMIGTVIPADEAGGDYFDFFTMKDDRIAMAVGDVSGHGAGPALFMSGARAYLRAHAQQTTSPRKILDRLNQHMVGDMGDDMFMSMFVCVLDPVTREFYYANAGHPPPILVHGDGTLEDYKLTGMALGVEEENDWTERGPYRLERGDTVVLFSDGVIEMRREGELYGRERLAASVRRHAEGSVEALLDGIVGDVLAFSGSDNPAQDDLTVAILRADP